jgi:hypothetical protein
MNRKITFFVRFVFACNASAFIIVFLGFLFAFVFCGGSAANRLLFNPSMHAAAWLIAPVFCFFFLRRD